MSEALYQRNTVVYICALIFVGLAVGVGGNYLSKYLTPPERPVTISHPIPGPTPNRPPLDNPASRPHSGEISQETSSPPLNTNKIPTGNIQHLKADHDSLTSRFLAIEASLRDRARDLGGQTIKPEIASSIATCRSDLTAAREALSVGDAAGAVLRMNRAKTLLEYLESL